MEGVGAASGILTLTIFAFKSSTVLYQLVESFRSNQRIVRELKEELEALNGVLEAFRDAAASMGTEFPALKLPLLGCGKACEDLKKVIQECSTHSGGSKTSFRDWAKIRYRGQDIAAFKNLLAGYKATISIALGQANFRTAAVTVNVLEEFKQLISNATADLEERLESIDERLRSISVQDQTTSNLAADQQQLLDERNDTQQCLNICTNALAQLEKAQPNAFISAPSAYAPQVTTLRDLTSSQQLTASTFKACKEKFTETTIRLEAELQDVDNRLKRINLQPANASNELAIEKEIMQEEKEAIKQSLKICAEASKEVSQERTNVYEDVSGLDDTQQMIISTVGQLISARRVTAGSRSLMLFGQLSDESVQHVSTQFGSGKSSETPTKVDPGHVDRYGAGVKLGSGKGAAQAYKDI